MFPTYRNQSVDLYCKSIAWFLYDGKTLGVNGLMESASKNKNHVIRIFYLVFWLIQSFEAVILYRLYLVEKLIPNGQSR